jgi:hypothetical protein
LFTCNYTKSTYLTTSRLLISIFALSSKGFICQNKIISQVGGG